MDKTKAELTKSKLDNVWLPWVVFAASLAIWLVIVYVYPMYFKQDDADMIQWINRHPVWDAFVPTKEAALWHDNTYRPGLWLQYIFAYKLFGMNSYLWHFLGGLYFILSLTFWFKLVKRLSGSLSGYLMILIWLGAFQFILTVLFWFTYGPTWLLACAGMYFFVAGLGESRGKMLLGGILMAASFLFRESFVLILPVAIALHLATEGRQMFKWGGWRTALYSLIPLAAAPLYVIAFPFIVQRQAADDSSLYSIIGAAVERYIYYSKFLSSNITGVLLLVPAMYLLVTIKWPKTSGGKYRFPVALISAGIISLIIMRTSLFPLSLLVLIIGGLLLPRKLYCLAVWGFIPIISLGFLDTTNRTYLYDAAFGFSAIAAVQASVLLQDLAEWWSGVVKSRVVTSAALAIALIGMIAVAYPLLQEKLDVLRVRSDISMLVKDITPYLEKLPVNSYIVVIDSPSMSISSKMRDLPDSIRVYYQPPFRENEADDWMKVIGRDDLSPKILTYTQYSSSPEEYHRNSKVFLWLQTPKAVEFYESLGQSHRVVASVSRGVATMKLVDMEF